MQHLPHFLFVCQLLLHLGDVCLSGGVLQAELLNNRVLLPQLFLHEPAIQSSPQLSAKGLERRLGSKSRITTSFLPRVFEAGPLVAATFAQTTSDRL